MKNLFLFVLVVLLFSACGEGAASGGKSTKDVLLGKWQLESVSSEELTESEKAATFEFKEDGTFVQMRGEMSRNGKWELSKGEGEGAVETLTMMAEDGGRKESSEIQEVSAKKLVIKSERGDIITLKKI